MELRIPQYVTGGARSQELRPLREDVPRTRQWDPDVLNARHREVLRLLHRGMKIQDVAIRVGFSPGALHSMVQSKLFQEELARLAETADADTIDVAEEIQGAAKAAVLFNAELINREDASLSLRHKAASDMLDRAGFGKVTRTQNTHAHTYFGQVGIEMLKKRAQEVISVEAEEVEVENG